MLSRDGMLEKLHKLDFCAIATVSTMDRGLQYDYVSSHGYGIEFATLGDWPAYMLRELSMISGIK